MVTVSCLLLLRKCLLHHHCNDSLGNCKQLWDHPVASLLSVRPNKTTPLTPSPSDTYSRFLNILVSLHGILSSFCFSSTGGLQLSTLFLVQPHQHWLKEDDTFSSSAGHNPPVSSYSAWHEPKPPLSTTTSSSTQLIGSQPIPKHCAKPPPLFLFKLYEVSAVPVLKFIKATLFLLRNNCIVPFKLRPV